MLTLGLLISCESQTVEKERKGKEKGGGGEEETRRREEVNVYSPCQRAFDIQSLTTKSLTSQD